MNRTIGSIGISFLLAVCLFWPGLARTGLARTSLAAEPPPTPTILSQEEARCVPLNTTRETGKVTRVVNGATIDVKIGGKTFRVHYLGLNTPAGTKTTGDFAPQAAARNKELVAGKTVTLVKDVSNTDKYGRLLRYVFVDGVFVNYGLVRQGFATAFTFPPDVSCSKTYQEAQRLAKENGLGLWKAPAGTPATPIPVKPGSGVCRCSANLYNCSSFKTRAEAQACFQYCIDQGKGDVHFLDGNQDGSVCQSLP